MYGVDEQADHHRQNSYDAHSLEELHNSAAPSRGHGHSMYPPQRDHGMSPFSRGLAALALGGQEPDTPLLPLQLFGSHADPHVHWKLAAKFQISAKPIAARFAMTKYMPA